MARSRIALPDHSTATIGFEAKLWLTADKLRNNMDAAEAKAAKSAARRYQSKTKILKISKSPEY